MKKFLLAISALCLHSLLCLAENGDSILHRGNIYYVFNDKTKELVFEGKSSSYNWEDYIVGSELPDVYKKETKSLIVKGTVQDIYSFEEFANLTDIDLSGASISHLNTKMCSYDANLNSIHLPSTLKSIGGSVFECNSIKEIIFDGVCQRISQDAFSTTEHNGEFSTIISKNKKALYAIDYDAISFNVPYGVDSLIYIGGKLDNLQTITLPNSLRYISANFFQNAPNLQMPTLPASIEMIGVNALPPSAYSNNEIITESGLLVFVNPLTNGTYKIPEGVTHIMSDVFFRCPNIKSVILPNSLHTIDSGAFDESKVTSITLTNNITSIGTNAFSNSDLSNIEIPSSVTTIGNHAFYRTKLSGRLVIPASVVSIGNEAFADTKIDELILEGSQNINKLDNYNNWINFSSIFGYPRYDYLKNQFKYVYLDRQIKGTIYADSVEIGPNIQRITSLVGKGYLLAADQYTPMVSGVKHLVIPNTVESIDVGSLNISTLETLSLPFIGGSRNPYPTNCLFSSIFGYEEVFLKEASGEVGNESGTINYKTRNLNIPENLKTIIFTGDTLNLLGWYPQRRVITKDSSYTWGNRWDCRDYIQNEDRIKQLELIIPNSTLKGIKGTIYNGLLTPNGTYYSYVMPERWYVPQDWGVEQIRTYHNPNYYEYTKDYYKTTDAPIVPYLCQHIFKQVNLGGISEIPQNLFVYSNKLESLTLPIKGYNCAGELFGTTEGIKGMEKTVYTDESGNTTNYYVPSSLREVRIAEGCTRIPYSCFSNFSMIKKVVLPTTITGVSKMAFQNCYSMDTLKVKRALPPVAFEESFEGCSQFSCVLQVPIDSKKYYSVANGWKYFFFIEEEAPLTVDVIKNIENAGEIMGITQYKPGETATITAVSHSGYKFSGWSLDGRNIVSTETEYSFEVENNTHIYAIFRPILNDNTVEIAATGGTATFTWNIVNNATKYVVRIYLDENMTALFAEYEVEANGNITRKKAPGTSDDAMTVQIDDMMSAGTYYYSVTGMDGEDHVVSEFTGVFDVATGVSEVCAAPVTYNFTPTGIILHDVNGLPIHVYTTTGTLVYATTATSPDVNITLPKGIYIVRTGNQGSMKVSIR